jgi:hypothetical protein
MLARTQQISDAFRTEQRSQDLQVGILKDGLWQPLKVSHEGVWNFRRGNTASDKRDHRCRVGFVDANVKDRHVRDVDNTKLGNDGILGERSEGDAGITICCKWLEVDFVAQDVMQGKGGRVDGSPVDVEGVAE